MLSIALAKIHCVKTTKEIDRDEPYVLATAADISGLVPQVEVVKYGPWADVKKGEDRTTLARPAGMSSDSWKILSMGKVVRTLFWGLDHKPKALGSTEGAIFVLSLVEHDASSSADATRELVKVAAVASLAGSTGLAYDVRVSSLVRDIKGALEVPTGAPNFEDPIGTQHLALGVGDLSGSPGSARTKTLRFTGQGGEYTATVEIAYS